MKSLAFTSIMLLSERSLKKNEGDISVGCEEEREGKGGGEGEVASKG